MKKICAEKWENVNRDIRKCGRKHKSENDRTIPTHKKKQINRTGRHGNVKKDFKTVYYKKCQDKRKILGCCNLKKL